MQPEVIASGRTRGPRRVRILLLMGLGAVYLAFLGVFAYVARGAESFPGELGATLWVQSWRAPWVDTVMTAISVPGFQPFGLALVSLTAAVLYVTGSRKESGLILAAALGATALNYVVGHVVDRPRPPGELVHISRDLGGPSFPSGHVTHYVVFVGTLTFILTRKMQPGALRRLAWAGLVLTLMAIGISRIYLGAHWLGDVVAGYAFGALVVAGVVGLWRQWIWKGEETDTERASVQEMGFT